MDYETFKKLDVPSNKYTKVPAPPEWMNPTMVKLWQYHCEFFLRQDTLFKTGIGFLDVFVGLEYHIIESKQGARKLSIDAARSYKEYLPCYRDYCDTMGIDSDVNIRIQWLKEQKGCEI